jgi:uncharacterized oxidoreductase
MNLSGNTVLITGGATGIGFALAEALLKRGNRVIICGRREERLQRAKQKHPELFIKVCDVADREDQRRLYEWATAEFPELNILVNNAGIQRDIDLTKGLEDILSGENEIRINLEGPIFLTALFMQQLLASKNPAIVNVSSGLAFRPMAAVPIYCTTKIAMHMYTQLLRQQLEGRGVKVFEAVPPVVETELNLPGRKKRNMPIRGIPADEFAAAVISGLEKDEFEIRYGMTKLQQE